MKITQQPGGAFVQGIPIQIPNEVRQNEPGFYISYNSSSRDYGCPTTALVLNDPQRTKFLILCGDHRSGFEAAATLEGCLAYFNTNRDQKHQYSDSVEG